jgi:hypothetical protein
MEPVIESTQLSVKELKEPAEPVISAVEVEPTVASVVVPTDQTQPSVLPEPVQLTENYVIEKDDKTSPPPSDRAAIEEKNHFEEVESAIQQESTVQEVEPVVSVAEEPPVKEESLISEEVPDVTPNEPTVEESAIEEAPSVIVESSDICITGRVSANVTKLRQRLRRSVTLS